MRVFKNWGYRLFPVFIFVAGVVTGVALSGMWVAAQVTDFMRQGPGALARTGSEVVKLQLKLDAEQRAELAPVFARIEAAFVVMHREDMAQVRVLFEETAREIRPRLRPAQREIMDEMLVAPRGRWEKFLGTPLPPLPESKSAE